MATYILISIIDYVSYVDFIYIYSLTLFNTVS